MYSEINPNIHDDKYDATVPVWAEFCKQPQIAEFVRNEAELRKLRKSDPRLSTQPTSVLGQDRQHSQ